MNVSIFSFGGIQVPLKQMQYVKLKLIKNASNVFSMQTYYFNVSNLRELIITELIIDSHFTHFFNAENDVQKHQTVNIKSYFRIIRQKFTKTELCKESPITFLRDFSSFLTYSSGSEADYSESQILPITFENINLEEINLFVRSLFKLSCLPFLSSFLVMQFYIKQIMNDRNYY